MNYKFLTIGSAAVGKTSWLHQIVNDKYDDKYTPSLIPQNYEFNHKKNKLLCIDIPGITTDKQINQLYDNINGIFLMCDMTGKGLENLKKWKHILDQSYTNIKYILIINKLDIDVEEEIDFDKFIKDNNINSLHAMSVKDNHAIMDPIDNMIELIQDYKTIKSFKPNESDIFIINFMNEIEKCVDDTNIKLKIKYVLLLGINRHVHVNINQLVIDMNKLFVDNVSINDILNYIIALY